MCSVVMLRTRKFVPSPHFLQRSDFLTKVLVRHAKLMQRERT